MESQPNIDLLVKQLDFSNQAVVLLHGIWMRSWVMRRLARRLSQQGYIPYNFSYQSIKKSPQQNAQLLAEYVRDIDQPVIHFIGHSLGGLVLLHYMNLENDLSKIGRVVLLGSPLKGSSRAPRIMKIPFGRALLGASVQQGLLGHELRFPADVDTGMVCGNFRMGVGMCVGPFGEPHDGTVAVSETQLEGLTDHTIVPVSHTGLLTSTVAAQQLQAFLKTGLFLHD